MTPYRAQTSNAVEELFEDEGFDRNADIVPSAVGVPTVSQISGEQWLEATKDLLGDSELDPSRREDAALLESLIKR